MHLGLQVMAYRHFVPDKYSAEITDRYWDQLDGTLPDPSVFADLPGARAATSRPEQRMVLTHLFPQSHDFFADFAAAATNAAAAAGVLASLFGGDRDGEDQVRRLRELEHRGDEITHGILSALGRSLVPEINREDVRGLARGLDDFVDDIEESGSRLRLYRLEPPTQFAQRLVAIVHAQAEVLTRAVSLLASADRDDMLSQHLVELHRLENEADDVLNESLATLYDGVVDVPGVVRARQWGELYGLLEGATDRAERVAHTLEGIVGQRH
jgi:uncharacterized protein Yka (UPF0111/DUF47 family)